MLNTGFTHGSRMASNEAPVALVKASCKLSSPPIPRSSSSTLAVSSCNLFDGQTVSLSLKVAKKHLSPEYKRFKRSHLHTTHNRTYQPSSDKSFPSM
jgi:hypothetical protein